jgi:hypothetical protein
LRVREKTEENGRKQKNRNCKLKYEKKDVDFKNWVWYHQKAGFERMLVPRLTAGESLEETIQYFY